MQSKNPNAAVCTPGMWCALRNVLNLSSSQWLCVFFVVQGNWLKNLCSDAWAHRFCVQKPKTCLYIEFPLEVVGWTLVSKPGENVAWKIQRLWLNLLVLAICFQISLLNYRSSDQNAFIWRRSEQLLLLWGQRAKMSPILSGLCHCWKQSLAYFGCTNGLSVLM